MIEIPDLDQLSLGPSSQFVEQAQNEEIENSLPPSNPSALAYMIDSSNVSTNNASDDYLNDLRAYKFGQSSGFASERLLPQFQPPQVQQHSGFSQHRIHDLPVESTSQISLGGEGEYELNTAQTMSITQSPQPKFLHSPNPNPNTNLSAHNNDVIDLQDVQEEVASGSVDATKTSELVIPEESLASAGVVEHAAIVEQQILEREQEQEQRELAGPIQFTPNPARKVSIDDHPVPMNYGMTPQLPPPGSTVDIIKPILSPTEKSKTDASSGASASASAGPGPTITDASSSHPSHSINFSNPRLTLSNGEELSSIRKELATELKTPTEYTLHILFTQFVRHAERKLNLCLDFPINEEPQIIDLLADGVDPQFDKIIASLGYIARKKPSPVIDSVMFWRKSKSEVASMAALEVEKAILSARQHGHTVNQNSIANQNTTYNNNQGYPAPQIPPVKAKRSLSLMRSKSISKITGGHKRNQSASSNLTTATTNLNNMTSLNSQISQEGSYIEAQIYQARETAIQADRKSLALIYILCRVLIEVVKQTSTEVMGEELGSKLEEIVYTQMKTTDPISTSESIVRSANWNLFAQLLGFMSEKQFVGVSDRFIADLEKIPSHITNDMEPKLHLLIHGMKYLTLTNYPLEKFEELAEFMQSLGKFFSKSMNESIIYAYCEVMSELVLPLANILTAETNHPTWVEAIETIFNKAFQIWNHNMKYQQNDAAISSSHPTGWSHSIGLMTSMLSVSRKELFSKAWFEVVEENLFKLKPKVDAFEKTHFITCVTRLVWVYLYRLPDSLNNTVKRLDSLFGHLFFNASITGKKLQWINTTNSGLIASLATLMRIVGYQHLNYMLDNVIIRLLKLCFNGFSLENVSCERLILVVKSYLAIIRSYERGIKPTFPHDSKKMTSKTVPSSTFDGGVDDFLFIAKNSNNSISHEEICKSLGNLLRLLDGQYGADIWTPELLTPVTAPVSKVPQTGPLNDVNSASGGASNSGSGGGFFHFGGLASDSSSKQLQVELFATIIDAIPWTLVPLGGDKVAACGIPFKSIVEILARNAVHKNLAVATAAKNSLKKLATRKNPSSLITIFAKIAFQLSEKPGPNYNSVYLNSPEFHRLLKIYVELLNCWLGQFNYINEKQSSNKTVNPLSQDDEMMNKDVLNDLYQINYKTDDLSNAENINKLKPSDELEWKNIITVIEEVEGNGLFFLCSQDSKTRHFGIYILKLVEQFDQEIFNITDTNSAPAKSKLLSPNGSKSHSRSSSKFAADIGTRLIHLLEDTDFLELIKPFKNEISIPERNRLSKLKNKKNILVKLAESDYGIDSTLWFRLFPKMLEIFFDRCPMPVALCRSVVCVRMVQMHEFILDFADTQKNYTSSLFSRSNNNYGGAPPEVLVNQWKLYLIFAACSLTTTGEQKISFPNQPTHGRKKSMQMYIQHQKITSAKSVFRMVFPLLKSKQPKVKDAVIQGLSCININIMESFLENMPSSLSDWTSSTGAGLFKKRDADEDRLRIETIHILSNVTHRFQNKIEEIYCDEWIVANLVTLIKNVKVFLSTPEVQTDLEFQKLRRYFCQLLENVFVGIKEASSNDLNRWLPFEARLGCFNFLKEWCGYGDVADIADDRYTTMMSKIANLKGELQQTTLAAAILEVERKALQIAALSCMSKLCSGPIRHEIEVPGQNAVLSFDIPGLQSWIHGLFSTDIEYCHEIGKQALRNILKMNPDNSEIYESVCHECITSQEGSRATESYFTVFVEVYIEKEKETEVEQGTRENEQEQESQLVLDDTLPYKVICLASLLVGNENYEVRFAAIKLLSFLELKYYNSYFIEKYVECVRSKTKVIYKKALFDISVALANEHPEGAFERISYLTMFFNMVNYNSRRDILSCLLPWVQIVELKDNEPVRDSDDDLLGPEVEQPPKVPTKNMVDIHINDLNPSSIMVLNNLFEITVKFSLGMLNEVEALWVALGSKGLNFDKIIEYIISNCLERRNPLVVEFAKQIIDYLAFSQSDSLTYLVDKLIGNLHPKAMVPPQNRTLISSINMKEYPYIANLWKLIPYSEKDTTFSLGQLSLVFLVDLFSSHHDRMIEKLPLLLHISFSLLDHYLYIVQEQAGNMLIHLIHALATKDEQTGEYSKTAKETIGILRQRDNVKHLWVYDDLNSDYNSKRGNSSTGSNADGRTPKNMDLLVRKVLEIFSGLVPSLQDDWSRVSLNWATTCAVRHIACRSFQFFRSLLSFLDQGMLKDMLHRLSNTISDDTVEIQGFAMQILMTLNAITAELDAKNLIDFPQLFWSSVACLSTIHEKEFIEVLSTMSKFVTKIDLDSPDTVSCLISTFPPKWEGKFEGLQQIVLVGLRSAVAWEPLLKFLDKMNTLKDSEVIGMGDSRLLMSLLSNLPRFLHALEKKEITGDIEYTCNLLSGMSLNNDKPALSRILISLGKNRFRSKKDFLNQTISTIKNIFFPQYEAQTLVFLLGLLSNKISWVKLETMNLLKYIFPLVDLTRDEFVGVGADLISPLLRLLLTNYAEQALEVLDEAVIISGSQLDKDVLRMLLGNTSMKKEYEKTATLFGIPDDSGWAIPMPAVTASSTRNNVHAVFSTCVVPNNNNSFVHDQQEVGIGGEDMSASDLVGGVREFGKFDGMTGGVYNLPQEDEEIHFHMEDYYGPNMDHNDGESITVVEPDASLSNMWAALDDFDSFLTKDKDHYQGSGNNANGAHPSGLSGTTNVDKLLNNYTKPSTSSSGAANIGAINSFGRTVGGINPNSHLFQHGHSASLDTKYSNISDNIQMDSAPLVYDKKASVILNRSLARSHSNTSFKTSLIDSMGGVLPGMGITSSHDLGIPASSSGSTAGSASGSAASSGSGAGPAGGSIVVTKRSYIPFRNSRTIIGKGGKGPVTGTPRTPTLEQDAVVVSNSPFRTPRIGSPIGSEGIFLQHQGHPGQYHNQSTPQHDQIQAQQVNTNGGSPRMETMNLPFEGILGGSKKKSKKSNHRTFSPSESSNSISPDLPYWGAATGQTIMLPNLLPTSPKQTLQGAHPRKRENKRSLQKTSE